jgi:hypothetical protein
MWRRTYLTLVLIRLWFALSPSYLHPDENFQGPEVIAGKFICLLLPTSSSVWTAQMESARVARGMASGFARDIINWPLDSHHSSTGANYRNRPDFQLPRSPYLGIYQRESSSKRLSTMARLWSSHAPPTVVMDR